MSRHDKKQRHNAKRQAKQHATRRRASISPIKRLADAPGEPECWISEDFEISGQMQIFAYKAAAGISGVACFLVDRGVVGLKDAWFRMRLIHEELEGMIEASEDRGIRMRRVNVETVRRWIAGGIRWADQNGMCLPKDWIKTASLIGGVGDWRSANLSGFVKEFAGHPDDLRQRLLAEPFEKYIQRDDIDFEFNDEAPYMDQETGEYLQADGPVELDEEEIESIFDNLPEDMVQKLTDVFTPGAIALTKETASWLGARGDEPSPGLNEAWRHVLLANLMARTVMPNAPRDEIDDLSFDMLEELSGEIEDPRYPEYDRGITQVLAHLESDPKLMDIELQKQIAAFEPQTGPMKMFPDIKER
ncbi:MAG TPA: hypothetical protein VGG44_12320 [Tepidisphaeraceae bacterium]|jgi:hypothetical protein